MVAINKALKLKQLKTREKILSTASRLFNELGLRATGIDRIISEGDFAKKTFYKHFSSKNELIAVYLKEKDRVWFERLNKYTSNPKLNPKQSFLSLFDALKEWYEEPDFFGCAFVRALSEFSDDSHDESLDECVQEHFRLTQELVSKLLKPLRPKDYKKLIPVILSLILGGSVIAYVSKSSKIADQNKEIANRLISLR